MSRRTVIVRGRGGLCPAEAGRYTERMRARHGSAGRGGLGVNSAGRASGTSEAERGDVCPAEAGRYTERMRARHGSARRGGRYTEKIRARHGMPLRERAGPLNRGSGRPNVTGELLLFLRSRPKSYAFDLSHWVGGILGPSQASPPNTR